MKGPRGFFAFVLIAALAIIPTVLGTVSLSAVVASEDRRAAGQPTEGQEFPLDPGDRDAGDASGDRDPGPGRTSESESQPVDEAPARDPEVTETRFTADRIITAAALQALLLAFITGLILIRRSARRRGDVVEGGPASTTRGGRPSSQFEGRRRSSGGSAGSLEPVHPRHVTRSPPAPIRAAPEQDAINYLCLSLADGRTIEGSMRGREANGLVLVIDVDYVIERDGTRRRGRAEDAFVPVSTVEHQQRVKGPRSA